MVNRDYSPSIYYISEPELKCKSLVEIFQGSVPSSVPSPLLLLLLVQADRQKPEEGRARRPKRRTFIIFVPVSD